LADGINDFLNFRSNCILSNHTNIHFHMQEWQARQRERTKEWHAYRQKEEAEEERITNEYREIGMRLKAYPQEEVRKARILVSSFIRAGGDVEEVTSHCAFLNMQSIRSIFYLMFIPLLLYDTAASHSFVDYGK
jgi:hypothetical protein